MLLSPRLPHSLEWWQSHGAGCLQRPSACTFAITPFFDPLHPASLTVCVRGRHLQEGAATHATLPHVAGLPLRALLPQQLRIQRQLGLSQGHALLMKPFGHTSTQDKYRIAELTGYE